MPGTFRDDVSFLTSAGPNVPLAAPTASPHHTVMTSKNFLFFHVELTPKQALLKTRVE